MLEEGIMQTFDSHISIAISMHDVEKAFEMDCVKFLGGVAWSSPPPQLLTSPKSAQLANSIRLDWIKSCLH